MSPLSPEGNLDRFPASPPMLNESQQKDTKKKAIIDQVQNCPEVLNSGLSLTKNP
jgi:hypothetical protein